MASAKQFILSQQTSYPFVEYQLLNILLRFTKPNMSIKIVGWLLGDQDEINQEMVNAVLLPSLFIWLDEVGEVSAS